jgi:hypothetical protein
MDIMDSWIKILRAHTDIPLKFCKATSYSLVAQTLGRFYSLGEVIGYRPNLYILISSPPRFTRRGALFGLFRHTINGAFKGYHNKLGDKLHLDEIKSHQMDGGSPQGLCDDVNRFRDIGIKSQAVRSPEFGRKLVDIFGNKGYMQGMDGIYLQLYSGESIYESFSRKNAGEPRYVPPFTYFNILGSMQGIEDYIKKKEIASMGFARRLSIWRVTGHEVLNDFKGMFGRDTKSMLDELSELGIHIGKRMYDDYKRYEKLGYFIPIPCTPDVKDGHTRIDEKLTRRAKMYDNNAYALFLQGQIDMLLKFSMNRAISKGQPVINMDIFNDARADVNTSTQDLRETFELLNIPKDIRNHERNLNALLNCIKNKKTKSETMRYMAGYGVKAEGIKKLVTELIMGNEIALNESSGWYVAL